MVTKLEGYNQTYDTIGLGEINILKGVGLRDIYIKFLLPNDLSLPFISLPYSQNSIVDKPITYMAKFREFKANKKPIRFMITRILPNGEEIFSGNMLVSIEDYTVYENAGENGDFWVELNLKEYIPLKSSKLEVVSEEENSYFITTSRTYKETSSTYTVKAGDSLWNIAKCELNDATRWSEIAEINNISDYKNLQIGTVLTLP